MKNKFFFISLISVLIIVVLFFIILISSLLTTVSTTESVRGISKPEIFFAIKLTLITATVSTVASVLLSIPIAYILSRYNFPGKNIVEIILYLPIVVSPIALGSMLLIFFSTSAGKFIENHFFRIVFEVPGIVFAQLIVIIGLSITLIKTVFDYINPEYENIARTLGANKFQSFIKVLLPSAKKGLVAAFLLTWARAVGEFGATVTLAGATTMKTETLPTAIFLSFASADVHSASIIILISLVISMMVLFVIRKVSP